MKYCNNYYDSINLFINEIRTLHNLLELKIIENDTSLLTNQYELIFNFL